jgi:hypothetical protein
MCSRSASAVFRPEAFPDTGAAAENGSSAVRRRPGTLAGGTADGCRFGFGAAGGRRAGFLGVSAAGSDEAAFFRVELAGRGVLGAEDG